MKNAGVRRDFELTSVRMRAMELILSRPGADSAKVRSVCSAAAQAAAADCRSRCAAQLSMLVAGPDWLTSVLAGMLGTSVWHVLAVQMAPTVLLIAGPATMAGAMQLRVQEGGSWQALSSLLLFFAAAVQVWQGALASWASLQAADPGVAGRGYRAVLLSHQPHRQAARRRAEGTQHDARMHRAQQRSFSRSALMRRHHCVSRRCCSGQAKRPRGGGASRDLRADGRAGHPRAGSARALADGQLADLDARRADHRHRLHGPRMHRRALLQQEVLHGAPCCSCILA